LDECFVLKKFGGKILKKLKTEKIWKNQRNEESILFEFFFKQNFLSFFVIKFRILKTIFFVTKTRTALHFGI